MIILIKNTILIAQSNFNLTYLFLKRFNLVKKENSEFLAAFHLYF